jgi:hypothetical protein
MFESITGPLLARVRTRDEMREEVARLDARIERVSAILADLEARTDTRTDAERDTARAAAAALKDARDVREQWTARIDAETARAGRAAEEVIRLIGDIIPEVPTDAADAPPLTSYEAELETAAAQVPEAIRAAVLAEVRGYGNSEALSDEVLGTLANMRAADHPLMLDVARRMEHFTRRNIQADVRLAWATVEERRHRPLVAIDAGAAHQQLVGGLGPMRMEALHTRGRVEFHAPGQLSLAFDLGGPDGLSGALIGWLSKIRQGGHQGGVMLRHWFACLAMWSEHGRSSTGLWTPTEHLRRMGLADTTRNRRAASEAINVLLASRIIVDAPGTCGRCACPFRWCSCSQPMRKAAGRWELRIVSEPARGLDWQSRPTAARILRAEPPIYAGVRLLDADGAPGSPGRNHAWLPPAIGRCAPEAIALGARAVIRMRWDKAPNLVLERQSAMEAAGICRDAHNPGRSRAALEAAIVEIRNVGFDVAELDGERLQIRPPPSVRDRLLGAAPRDALPHDPTRDPTTGAELRAWRLGREWTQKEAADAIGVGLSTYERWEAAAALPRGAPRKLRAVLAPGEGGTRMPRQSRKQARKRR